MVATCSPNDLYYNLGAEYATIQPFGKDTWCERGSYLQHLDNDVDPWGDYDSSEKITIRIYKDFDFDGRRFWRLASIWYNYNGEPAPVMIIQNAGREGDDHTAKFITNYKLYKKMVQHINSLLISDVGDSDVVDPATPIENLLTFYGCNLHDGPFEQY